MQILRRHANHRNGQRNWQAEEEGYPGGAFGGLHIFGGRNRLNHELGTEDGANGANQPGKDSAGTDVAIPGPVVGRHLLNHRRKAARFGEREAHDNQDPEVLQGAVQQGHPGHAFHTAKGEVESTDNRGNKGGHWQIDLQHGGDGRRA